MTYRVLAPALRDLGNIEDWVASEFGETVAAGARRKLQDTFQLLATFPHLGRARPELTSAPLRFYSVPPNWIVYRPGEPLTIHRVFDARVNTGRLKL